MSEPDARPSAALSGLFVQPIAQRIADWTWSGKLDEDDLDALSTEARAWVEHSIAHTDWAGLADVEGLIDAGAVYRIIDRVF